MATVFDLWIRSSPDDARNSSASASWTSPGAGITGGYDGDSQTLRIFIVFFAGLAMYNAVELMFMIFLTFTQWRGLYFWSLLLSGLGIIPYSLGFLLKFMNATPGDSRWAAVVLLTIGWYPMITGQALVLWSRLHLLVSGPRGDKIIRWTKWMIIVDAICLHIPTTVLTFGSNGNIETDTFEYGYNIMEKIQMAGFFLQEVILSTIYIVETIKLLRTSLQPGSTRKTMQQLILINIFIIVLDLGLLGLEAASLYILETLLKGVIYSIKLKLEFAILGKLVKFVGGRRGQAGIGRVVGVGGDPRARQDSIGFVTIDRKSIRSGGGPAPADDLGTMDVRDFVDLERVHTDYTHAVPRPSVGSSASARRRAPHGAQDLDLEYEFARFENVDEVTSLGNVTDDASSSSSSSSSSSLGKTAQHEVEENKTPSTENGDFT